MAYYNFISDVSVDDTLNVGSNVLISDVASDFKVNVVGGLFATELSGDGSNITNLTLTGDGSSISGLTPDQITATDNSHSNTVQFANATLSLFTDGPAGIGAAPGAGEDFVVGSVLTVDADAAEVLTVAGNVTATNVNADFVYGDASNMTNLTGASAATYADSNTVAQVVVDATGRITGISDVNISFQDVTRTNGTTDAALQSASLVTTGGVGVSNTNSLTYDLSVGDALFVDVDGSADGNVLVVNGNVSATYYFGDGSHLEGVASVDTLDDVVARGNTTSTIVSFTGTGTSFTASGDAVIVGDVTANAFAGDARLLTNVVHATGSGAQTYGSAGKVPTLAINANGQITNVDEVDVQSNVNGGATTNELAFYTSATQVGPISGLSWDSSALTVPGNLTLTNSGSLTVPGDLHVSGNTIISNNVSFEDTILVVGNNATATDTVGFIYERPGDFASVGIAYQGSGDTNVLTFSYTNDDGAGATVGVDTSNLLPIKIYGTIEVTSDATANAFSGSAELLTSVGDVVSQTVNDSSNVASSLTFDAEGRITGTSTTDLSLNNIALTDPQISQVSLQLSNTTSLTTTGRVGIANANPQHELSIGTEVFVDSSTGDITANAFIGDGSMLTGLIADNTLAQVVDKGNTTSNVVQFQNSTTALVITETDAAIHFASNVQLSADGTGTYISEGAVRVLDAASNILAFTTDGEVVQSGIAIDAAKAVSIHDQKLFVSTTKSCTAGAATNVAKLTFPASKTSLIKVDAFVNDGTNSSAHHAEYLVASVSGGSITNTQIVGFGSNNIVGSAGTPVTGVSLSDAGSSILDVNVTLGAGTNQTVSFTVEASAIAGVTLSSLP